MMETGRCPYCGTKVNELVQKEAAKLENWTFNSDWNWWKREP